MSGARRRRYWFSKPSNVTRRAAGGSLSTSLLGLDRSAKPARMKATGNPVANYRSNSFADCCDLAGAIG
jgi:hypothetical protein